MTALYSDNHDAEGLPLSHCNDLHARETLSHLPKTTTGRRRASVAETSLDKDETLSEKVRLSQPHVARIDKATPIEKTVLYLAYGSNLCAETFLGKRGIRPLSQINVVVPDLQLTFDLPGLPYIEPCFAATQYRHVAHDNLDDEDEIEGRGTDMSEKKTTHKDYQFDGPLVGVVYEVTLSDYARIIATEGGGGGYKDIVADCYPFPQSYDPADPVPECPATTPFKAHTLLSPVKEGDDDTLAQYPLVRVWSSLFSRSKYPGRPHPSGYAQPSARYLNLITTGAAEHNLPLSYQTYLSQVQTYQITTVQQRIGQVIFVALWGPFMLLFLILSKAMAGPDGRSPSWVMKLNDLMLFAMWASYDNVFVKVFGDGERTIGGQSDTAGPTPTL
ncbi:hypothetical protein EYZ11_003393 [Aspergillus tanneri]|uniref:gamma-glutamylcyclotransferase n=1 Tax=Aspergillus tanneri TaxID=1220188 RepID=A0A4S3JNX1_9EURO|nr:uncharacterized protein ATNIH1004_010426 [Aspergillus tanneri]KAA8643657.1 hypothetical protein ATNIH1004_010426 [Aspergillus tanneri]THC97130.1 hypothetical protein EYZ11_003393 [Aspergillus tanneri]